CRTGRTGVSAREAPDQLSGTMSRPRSSSTTSVLGWMGSSASTSIWLVGAPASSRVRTVSTRAGRELRPALRTSGMCDLAMPDDFILQWGNPALGQIASPVESFDDLLRAQAARLCRRLIEANGAGLAATQIGWLRRIFAFRFSPEHDVE